MLDELNALADLDQSDSADTERSDNADVLPIESESGPSDKPSRVDFVLLFLVTMM